MIPAVGSALAPPGKIIGVSVMVGLVTIPPSPSCSAEGDGDVGLHADNNRHRQKGISERMVEWYREITSEAKGKSHITFQDSVWRVVRHRLYPFVQYLWHQLPMPSEEHVLNG